MLLLLGESRDLGLRAGGPAGWVSSAGCGGPESAGPWSPGPFNGLTGRLLPRLGLNLGLGGCGACWIRFA